MKDIDKDKELSEMDKIFEQQFEKFLARRFHITLEQFEERIEYLAYMMQDDKY